MTLRTLARTALVMLTAGLLLPWTSRAAPAMQETAGVAYTVTDLGKVHRENSAVGVAISDAGTALCQEHSGGTETAAPPIGRTVNELPFIGTFFEQPIGSSFFVDRDGQREFYVDSFVENIAFDVADVNNCGEVAGTLMRAPEPWGTAFVWSDHGLTFLGSPHPEWSYAAGINDNGEVVGWAKADNSALHAYLWRDGMAIDLGTLPGDDFSVAKAINNAGVVVGVSWAQAQNTGEEEVRAFVWRDGEGMTELEMPAGGQARGALAINDRGQIVGYVRHKGEVDTRAVRWDDDAVVDLWDLNFDFEGIGFFIGSAAYAINGVGSVIGTRGFGSPTEYVLWEDGQLVSLSDLVASGGDWTRTGVAGIDDAGRLLATGATGFDEGSTHHCLLLTPA